MHMHTHTQAKNKKLWCPTSVKHALIQKATATPFLSSITMAAVSLKTPPTHSPLTFTRLSRLQSESQYRWRPRQRQHLFVQTREENNIWQFPDCGVPDSPWCVFAALNSDNNKKSSKNPAEQTNSNNCDYASGLNQHKEDSEQRLLTGDRQNRQTDHSLPSHTLATLWDVPLSWAV